MGWFEVYKIQVPHVTPNRKFKEITLYGSGTHTIYQRGEDEDLPINQPLSLLGYKPVISCDYFHFQIGDDDWWWGRTVGVCAGRDDPEDIPISTIIRDPETDSCVQIWCEFIVGCDLAQIRVLFLDEQLKMRILRGQICVTNVCKDEPEYDIERKHLLQVLPSHPSSAAEQDIMLDRSVVALSYNRSFRVEVDFIYSIEPPGDEEEERIFSISKSGNIDIPRYDDGTYDIEFKHESGVSPVVKVEFCVLQPFGTIWDLVSLVMQDCREHRESEVVGLEDLEDIDSSLKSLFDD